MRTHPPTNISFFNKINRKTSPSLMAEPQPDDDDDDFFGDFKFVPSPSPSPLNTTPRPNDLDEDDWGDFVSPTHQNSILTSQNPTFLPPENTLTFSFDPLNAFSFTKPIESESNFQFNGFFTTHTQNPSNSPPPPSPIRAQSFSVYHSVKQPIQSQKSFPFSNKWEKPTGALPLSLFGELEEEVEEDEEHRGGGGGGAVSVNSSTQEDLRDAFSTKSVSPVVNGSGTGLNDLIGSLYGRNEPIKTENEVVDNGLVSKQEDLRDAFSSKSVSPVVNGSGIGFDDLMGNFYGQNELKKENGSVSNQVVENGSISKQEDLRDAFSSKSALPVINGFDDLIGSLYSQNELKNKENGSVLGQVAENRLNFNQVVENGINSSPVNGFDDRNGDFDEDDWEFKVADADSGVKVDDKIWGNSEGSEVTSGFSNSAQFGGDWFLTSDSFSTTPSTVDNGFHFESSVTLSSTSNIDLLTEPNQVAAEDGKDSYPVDENFDSDENFGDFKDASPEPEPAIGSSWQKEGVKISDQSGFDRNELLFNDGIQENLEGSENDKGPLPLSIFSNGELDSNDPLFSEDVYSFNPPTSLSNGINTQVFSSDASLSDVINNLYNQAEHIPANGSTRQHAGNGFSSAQTVLSSGPENHEDDFGDSSFKDASTETRTEAPSFVDVGHVHQNFPSESKMKNFVHFYSTLKGESFFIALHHLDGMKKAEEVAAVSGENARAATLHEEIQAVCRILYQENVVSDEFGVKEHPSRSIYLNELLAAMKEPKFQVLESEYQLSRRISLAEQELSAAVSLFEHAISMLKILTLGSMEDQSNYITTWSRMISASVKELNHGTSIWKQSLQKNVHKNILSTSKGRLYILALGEIYRLVGILRASVTLYKPWILSSLADPFSIFSPLEECISAWTASGVEEALQSISEPVDTGYDGTIKALLESIKAVHDIDVLSLHNHIPLRDPICRLSLLSLSMMPAIKPVIWNGEHYFLAVANFWVNRVSCYPPKLPQIHAGS